MAQQSLENIQTIKRHDPIPSVTVDVEVQETRINPLATPDAQARLRKLNDWWIQAQQAQSLSRYEMMVDHDFRDGLQWRDDDKQVLIDRGQWPLVFNKILPAVNWIVGAEKRMQVDWRIDPRTEDDVESAQVKTKLLKYTSDVNKTTFARSRAFDDAVTGGLGWIETGMRDDPTEEPLFARYEDWRNIWYDHLGGERDLSDARYLFRAKWLDLDLAIAMFPESKSHLEAASIAHNLFGTDDDEFWWLSGQITQDGRVVSRSAYSFDAFASDTRRPRVKLIEAWYREPMQVQVMRGYPRIEGTLYDQASTYHAALIEMGYASLYDALRMQVRCAVFIPGGLDSGGGTLLQDMVSPYRHNRFPFVPIWCYRRKRDGTPYGTVRNCRDPQEDLNKRRSKALYILSSKGMIADEDAFEDWDEAADEMSRPDMILKKKRGAAVQIVDDRTIAGEHFAMEQEDAKYIQDVSGITDQNEGRQANAISGVAVDKLQYQGSLLTAELFDNLRYAIQLHGEIELSLIEQFYDFPKMVRLVGPRGQAEFLAINHQATDTLGQPLVENDITASQADFIVSEQDFHESVRQAIFESMMQLCSQLPPEMSVNLLDLVVDMVDMPGKDELVKRIRNLNGQADPDARNDPETQQRMAVLQQQRELEAQLQQRSMMQSLEEQRAKIEKMMAETKLILEKADAEDLKTKMGALKTVVDAGRPTGASLPPRPAGPAGGVAMR